jgi:hypothetical protein
LNFSEIYRDPTSLRLKVVLAVVATLVELVFLDETYCYSSVLIALLHPESQYATFLR